MATKKNISLASVQTTSNQLANKIVLSIDPGTGVSSPTGISLFDPESKEIYFTTNLHTKYKPLEHRIRDITLQLAAIINEIPTPYLICVESFVMRGRGGETLQRMIGAYMSTFPYDCKSIHVQNTTVKKVVGGSGKAEKDQVAAGVAAWFASNTESTKLIKDLTSKGEFDILDSLAIGVTGWTKVNS